MKVLSCYENGNYQVVLFDNGTKIRKLKKGESEFKPAFPENIDLEISKKCNIGCPWCYAGCTPDSPVFGDGDIAKLYELKKSIHPGTELAIGGGALSCIERGQLIFLLFMLKQADIITNITVNVKELLNDEFLNLVIKCIKEETIYGLGISYNSEEKYKNLLKFMQKETENLVVHTIYGITTLEDYKWLAENNFKVLILGYKDFGRGHDYKENSEIKKNMEEFNNNFENLKNSFKLLSFDCLAVEQLKMKERISREEWNQCYMGDDGEFTMFIDFLGEKFCKNSITPENERFDFYQPGIPKLTIPEMFKMIRTNN